MPYVNLTIDKIDREVITKTSLLTDIPRPWVGILHRFQWNKVIKSMETDNNIYISKLMYLQVREVPNKGS